MAKEKDAKSDEEKEDEGVYNEEGREEMVADDEMSPEEEGFMKGYDDADEESNEESDDKSGEKSEEKSGEEGEED